jgi:signal transduction histidine kinase/YHS domain-containing protein
LNDWVHVALTGLFLLAATNLWLVLRVLKPLRRLAVQAGDLSRGNLMAFQQPCGGVPEIGILRQSMASMAAHVRRAQEEGTAYRHALTDGQEAERARIAHELHDDTVQALVAIAQSIDLATTWIEKDPARTTAMLKTARVQAVETVEGLRRLIADLRPPALEELGLMPALHMLAENEEGIAVTINVTGKERRLHEMRELTLFRAAQEAIHNAQRHGQAQHITVAVHYQPQQVRLTIRDDGAGFNLPEPLDCLAIDGHYGLLGMHERIHHLNGDIHLSSKPGHGTQIVVTLPVDTVDQPTEAVRDPVCGAIIQPHQAYGSVQYKDHRYYFCCPVCQGAFQSDPDLYLTLIEHERS